MPRSRAIAVGLVTNELVINAVKHGFPNDREGNIDVRFQRKEAGWSLIVSDDGIGLSQDPPRTGLGTNLLEEFARQAGGVLTLDGEKGTVARMMLPLSAAMSAADAERNLV